MRKRVIFLKMSLLLVCSSVRAQAVIPAHVSIDILGFDKYNGVAIACKHNPTGRFQANYEFEPDKRVETKISGPVLTWSISPATTDVSLTPSAGTDTPTVDVKMENDAAYGKEYSVTVTATWKVRMTATGKEDEVTAKASVTLVAIKVELIPTSPLGQVDSHIWIRYWNFRLSTGVNTPLPYTWNYVNNYDPDAAVLSTGGTGSQTVPNVYFPNNDTFYCSHACNSLFTWHSGTARVTGTILCDNDAKTIALVDSEGDFDYDYVPVELEISEPNPIQSYGMVMTLGSTHEINYSVTTSHGFNLGGSATFSFENLKIPLELQFNGSYEYSRATQSGTGGTYPYEDWDGAKGSDNNPPDDTNEAHYSVGQIFRTKTLYEARKYLKNPDGSRGVLLDTAPITLWGILLKREWSKDGNGPY